MSDSCECFRIRTKGSKASLTMDVCVVETSYGVNPAKLCNSGECFRINAHNGCARCGWTSSGSKPAKLCNSGECFRINAHNGCARCGWTSPGTSPAKLC